MPLGRSYQRLSPAPAASASSEPPRTRSTAVTRRCRAGIQGRDSGAWCCPSRFVARGRLSSANQRLLLGLVRLQCHLQNLRIGCEVLQNMQRPRKSENRHALARLELLLYEFQHLPAGISLIGERGVQRIEQQDRDCFSRRTVLRPVRVNPGGQLRAAGEGHSPRASPGWKSFAVYRFLPPQNLQDEDR